MDSRLGEPAAALEQARNCALRGTCACVPSMAHESAHPGCPKLMDDVLQRQLFLASRTLTTTLGFAHEMPGRALLSLDARQACSMNHAGHEGDQQSR